MKRFLIVFAAAIVGSMIVNGIALSLIGHILESPSPQLGAIALGTLAYWLSGIKRKPREPEKPYRPRAEEYRSSVIQRS